MEDQIRSLIEQQKSQHEAAMRQLQAQMNAVGQLVSQANSAATAAGAAAASAAAAGAATTPAVSTAAGEIRSIINPRMLEKAPSFDGDDKQTGRIGSSSWRAP